jgi:hypothetical protein
VTIDERLEALTQSVELLAGMMRDNEVKFDRRINAVIAAIEKDGENIRSLARIAEAHEHRLDRLEDKQ